MWIDGIMVFTVILIVCLVPACRIHDALCLPFAVL
jgi:hypothetical protein